VCHRSSQRGGSAEESLDRLAHLTASLLDVSRLQAGARAVFPRPADLGEIVVAALEALGPQPEPLLTARTAGNRVELRVVDHGPGIPAADRKRVFQPFCRLGAFGDSTGVGLGLAVAGGLAETMGGTVEPERHPRRRAPRHPPDTGCVTRWKI
jgi:two-component system, OmpR family, sensor histidine kinase KdpD